MRLTGREREMDRQAVSARDQVNLARESSSRASSSLVLVLRDACSVLVHAHDEEDCKTLLRYWTNTCHSRALKGRCTTGKERRIGGSHDGSTKPSLTVQARLDGKPVKMGLHRRTVEHPFGTIMSWRRTSR